MKLNTTLIQKIVILLIISTNITGCSLFQEQYDYPDFDGDILSSYTSTMDFTGLLSKENPIESVNTRSSILYKNDHQRQMYVFSTPVREYVDNQYGVYDLTLYPNGERQFATKTNAYQLTVSETDISLNAGLDELRLLTEDMQLQETGSYLGDGYTVSVTPSYSGYILNYTIDTPMEVLSLTFAKTRYEISEDNAGYVLLSDEGSNKYIINQMIVLDQNNQFTTDHEYKVKKSLDQFTLTSAFSAELTYPIQVSVSVDLYCDNMFYDASVYEAEPNLNTIFNQISVFDTIADKNDGYTYLKFNIRSFTPKQSSLLDSIYLNLYAQHHEGDAVIEVYSVQKDWCSWTLCWNTRPKYSDKIGEFTVNAAGWYSIDLTDYVRHLIDNDYYGLEDNSIMLRIKDGNSSRLVLSSTDNKMHPPFFEVNYRTQ